MAIAIQPYTEDRIQSVSVFNQRLAQGGCAPEFQFPESHIPHWLPKKDGQRIFQEYYLAIENDVTRGGFILKHQDFCLRGQSCPVAYYHLPLSEGIINKAYATTGVLMLRSAIKMQPLLYALGMGGFENPLPRMLEALGWRLSAVPFYFKVNHPFRFLRNIGPLQQSRPKKAIANLAAFSGAGWMGIKSAQWLRSRNTIRELEAEPVTKFGSWADELWQECSPLYGMIGSRESGVLNTLYPSGKKFHCFKIMRGSKIQGWVVVRDTQMSKNKYFGDLRLGSLVDCLATPEHAPSIVQAAVAVLEERGVDLIISNHSHAEWGKAFRSSGFFSARSNFIFAASKALAERLSPWESGQREVYLMRGDGDGPVNL